ncbi:hypothetical protein CPB84DRAFT_1781078, partial [Gymnopilus junonius]
MPGRSVSFFNSLKHRSFDSFRQPSRFSSSISLPIDLTQFSSNSAALTHAQRSSLQDLTSALSSDASPSYVWANYTNLISSLGSESLPLEYHQQVLRRCSPPKKELKSRLVGKLSLGKDDFVIPAFESRFQTLMGNIRNLGLRPSLDDYNFVLEQFAAVGYYEGAIKVYEEIKRVGHVPNHETFGFCFQAMAYRLTLPIPQDSRENTIAHMQSVFRNYLSDMRHYQISMTGAHLDLSIRILKETLDYQGFDSILRWGYAIDLSNPDRVALEYSEPSKNKNKPFPFTTTALNTTIDILGRLGDVSKLVQAFEVLTQPLPQANQHFFNSFESDEDDDFGVSVDVGPASRFQPAYALPNTTTYNLLLRYICKNGHGILARHYIMQATRLDRSTAWTLRHMVTHYLAKKRPLSEIPSPHFAISRLTLLPVLGESNRDKNLGLMKWLSTKVPGIISKQKNDLEFYLSVSKRLDLSEPPPPQPPLSPTDVSDLDVTNPAPPDGPRTKFFDIHLHIRILKRNIIELEDFRERLTFVLGRTTQRVKERLGRRVWDSKDIFLTTEQDRVYVTKDHWKDVVNFQPRKDNWEPLRHRNNISSRRMSTFAPIFYSRVRPLDPPPIPIGVQRGI